MIEVALFFSDLFFGGWLWVGLLYLFASAAVRSWGAAAIGAAFASTAPVLAAEFFQNVTGVPYDALTYLFGA